MEPSFSQSCSDSSSFRLFSPLSSASPAGQTGLSGGVSSDAAPHQTGTGVGATRTVHAHRDGRAESGGGGVGAGGAARHSGLETRLTGGPATQTGAERTEEDAARCGGTETRGTVPNMGVSCLYSTSDKNGAEHDGTATAAAEESLSGEANGAQPMHTPSPLTISARDIEPGSLDFTEVVTGLEESQSHTSLSEPPAFVAASTPLRANEVLTRGAHSSGSTAGEGGRERGRKKGREGGSGNFCEALLRSLSTE